MVMAVCVSPAANEAVAGMVSPSEADLQIMGI